MLIGDINTLQTINSLYLTKQIILYRPDLFDLQQVMRVDTTLCQLVASLKLSTVCNLDAGTVRDQIRLLIDAIRNNDLAFLLGILDRSCTAKLRDDRKSFRFSRLEKLLDTRKTLRDIIAGNASAVECSHRKLCTRLTDRLCRDDTDSLTDLNRFTGRHVGTITFCTDTNMRLTAENISYLYLLDGFALLVNAFAENLSCPARRDHMILLHQNVAVPILNILTGISPCDSVF